MTAPPVAARERRRRIFPRTVATVITALALLLAVAAPSGASAATTTSGSHSEARASSSAETSWTSAACGQKPDASGTVDVASGLRLVAVNISYSNNNPCQGLPSVISSRVVFVYKVRTSDWFFPVASVDARYQIQENQGGSWKPSGFDVLVGMTVPAVGNNQIRCRLYQSSTESTVDWSPFACQYGWKGDGHGWDPGGNFLIKPKPVTTIDASMNPTAAQAAIKEAGCTTADSPQCKWESTSQSAITLPDNQATQLTHVVDSCPPKTTQTQLAWNQSVQMSWSDNIGLKSTTKVAFKMLGLKAEESLELSYQHTVSQTTTWSQTVTQYVPVGYSGALFLSPGVVQVKGDFTLYSADKTTVIKGIVVDFPLANTFYPPPPQTGQAVQVGVIKMRTWGCGTTSPRKEKSPVEVQVRAER